VRTRTVGDLREGAARVLARADLDEVYLVRAEIEGAHPVLAPPFETDTDLRVRALRQHGQIQAWCRYVVTSLAEGRTAQQAWRAEVECIACFDYPPELPTPSEEDLEAFAFVVGSPILHPYGREFLQGLTSKTAYPAFTMGLLLPIDALDDDYELVVGTDDEADQA
jgi:hypothetical protein